MHMAIPSFALLIQKLSVNHIGFIWLKMNIELVVRELEFVITGKIHENSSIKFEYKFYFPLVPSQKSIWDQKDEK